MKIPHQRERDVSRLKGLLIQTTSLTAVQVQMQDYKSHHSECIPFLWELRPDKSFLCIFMLPCVYTCIFVKNIRVVFQDLHFFQVLLESYNTNFQEIDS